MPRRSVSNEAATRTESVTSTRPALARRPDAWYVGEWARLARAVLGPGTSADAPSPSPSIASEIGAQARRQRAQAALAEAIAHGEDLERATYRGVATLAANRDWNAAWSTAQGIGRLPGGARAGAIGHAVLLHRRRQFDRAWNAVRDLDDEALATYLPVEAVDAALAIGTAAARQRALAVAVPSPDMDARVLVDLAGRFLAFGEHGRAADLVTELRRRSSVDLDRRRRRSWALIEGWLTRRATSIPSRLVPVAVMGYQSPDHGRASGNVGDYIQTLSLLGNLARLSNARFSGDDGLGALATELQGRVQPHLRLPEVNGSVHLVAVDRDFSSARDVPPGTWMVAFGWHMLPLYDLRCDFPYQPNIRPLFLSFHLNGLEMLTDEARAYLRRYGPVGCRDWNTVFLLLSAGIDAFFTGCLSTTVDTLYPAREIAYRGDGPVGVIDLPRRTAGRGARNVRVYGHHSDDFRNVPVAVGLRAADDLLGAYQADLDRAVTGRLHAYLPLVTLGVPVDFRPASPGDVRFAGLTDLRPGDARLTEMREGIRDLVSGVLEKVVAGAPESEVYGLWRDRALERVAEARARFEAPVVDMPTTIDVRAAVATGRAGSRRFGPHDTAGRQAVTDIVLCFDQGHVPPAAVLLESIVAHAAGTLRLWVLGRGLTIGCQEWLAAAFPAVPMTFVPCDGITFEGSDRLAGSTASTTDRLLIPEMLADLDRVVCLDVDSLLLDDVCRLAAIDLGDRPLAAGDAGTCEASEWRRAGRPLAEERATDLRRRMGLRHGYGPAALDAGVLVMDLDRMRRDRFTVTALGWVEQFGLDAQDCMLAYVGPDRCVLDSRWNARPDLEDVPDPSLIRWANIGKPWEPLLTYGQDRWHEHAAHLHERAGVPPTAGGPD
jgi:lipopolysaccharide biosynthesis glycosyltransferase